MRRFLARAGPPVRETPPLVDMGGVSKDLTSSSDSRECVSSAANIPAQPVLAQVTVYDGRACLGEVGRIADGWEAIDAAGRSLGTYTSEASATAAVDSAARKPEGRR